MHILVSKFHLMIGRHRPLLYAGLNGRWTEFGVKDMIFEQKKLKVNLHFPVGEFQLSRRNRIGRHQSSDLDGIRRKISDFCTPVVILLVKKDFGDEVARGLTF